MKSKADGKRRDVTFEVGDKVYLKLRPYRQISVAKRPNQKLSPRFYGPYTVLERIGSVAYRLELPETARIHPVFHVSQLKQAIGAHPAATSPPADLTDEHAAVFLPQKIIGAREVAGHREVLVWWKDLPEEEATWEAAESLLQQFPDLHLEDKVFFPGGGDDTTHRWGRVYHRKQPKKGRIGSVDPED